jgi:hypothetical protein
MNLIDKLLALFGCSQTWHIAWVARPAEQPEVCRDTTITVRPRLRDAGLNDVRMFLAQETSNALGVVVPPQQIQITSLTRIAK